VRALGLPTASSEVLRFGAEVAIVVERFDRVVEPERILRAHQEDFCQALGVHPARKYQSDGGPTPARIARTLRESSTEPAADVATFADALALSWILGATDGHAKNYALLHAPRGRVRLAPIYDVASALPYPRLDRRRLRLAMSIGGERKVREIHGKHVRKLAGELALDPDALVSRWSELAGRAPDAVSDVAKQLRSEGVVSPIVTTLERELVAHAHTCATTLARS
jgi:serine/threonine-protein kinase HipA